MARLQPYLQRNGMTMLVSLPANDMALAKAALEEGADGLKVHFNVGHRASGTTFEPMEAYERLFAEIRAVCPGPLGAVPAGSLTSARREDMRKLVAMDFDFYSIYAHHLPSFMIQTKEIDRTFAIDDTYDLSLLDGAHRFGFAALEASIVPGSEYGTPLSFKDVLKYRRLADRSSMPIIVPSQRKLVPEDVQTLHEAGAKAVLLGAVAVGTTEDELRRAVSAFRDAIDRLVS